MNKIRIFAFISLILEVMSLLWMLYSYLCIGVSFQYDLYGYKRCDDMFESRLELVNGAWWLFSACICMLASLSIFNIFYKRILLWINIISLSVLVVYVILMEFHVFPKMISLANDVYGMYAICDILKPQIRIFVIVCLILGLLKCLISAMVKRAKGVVT